MCAVGQDQQTRIGVGDSSIGSSLGAVGGGTPGATFMGGPDENPGAPKQGWTRNAVLAGSKTVTSGVTASTPGAKLLYQTPRQRDKGDPGQYGVTQNRYI